MQKQSHLRTDTLREFFELGQIPHKQNQNCVVPNEFIEENIFD